MFQVFIFFFHAFLNFPGLLVQMVANSEWMHIFKLVWSLNIFFILFLTKYMFQYVHTFPAVFRVHENELNEMKHWKYIIWII